MHTIDLSFSGPFGWSLNGPLPTILSKGIGDQPGIYLWTAGTDDGELVWYVGETARSFRQRMREHLVEQLGGRYRILDPVGFEKGRKSYLWHGGYGESKGNWPDRFLTELPTLAKPLAEFVRVMRFMIAPLDSDTRVRRRIEAALADYLYAQPDPVGSFQEEIYYERTRPDEEPLQVTIASATPIRGLPATLLVDGNTAQG